MQTFFLISPSPTQTIPLWEKITPKRKRGLNPIIPCRSRTGNKVLPMKSATHRYVTHVRQAFVNTLTYINSLHEHKRSTCLSDLPRAKNYKYHCYHHPEFIYLFFINTGVSSRIGIYSLKHGLTITHGMSVSNNVIIYIVLARPLNKKWHNLRITNETK
jgi:hypothetical protein